MKSLRRRLRKLEVQLSGIKHCTSKFCLYFVIQFAAIGWRAQMHVTMVASEGIKGHAAGPLILVARTSQTSWNRINRNPFAYPRHWRDYCGLQRHLRPVGEPVSVLGRRSDDRPDDHEPKWQHPWCGTKRSATQSNQAGKMRRKMCHRCSYRPMREFTSAFLRCWGAH